MRALIRPTLFLVARLGLFLSAVMWIASQWWEIRATGTNSGRTVTVLLAREGVLTGTGQFGPTYVPWRIETAPVDPWEWTTNSQFFTSQWVDSVRGHPDCSVGTFVPGIVAVLSKVDVVFVTRHWLTATATVFGLFNGVLMWVYRKREKELAADE